MSTEHTTTAIMPSQSNPGRPIGLANIGSTCYMNTAIQCLVHALSFSEVILNPVYDSKQLGLMTEFREVVELMSKNHDGPVRMHPHKFASILAEKLRPLGMRVFEQNDIHEFVVCLLDLLNRSVAQRVPEELIARVERTIAFSNGKENTMKRFMLKCDRAWYQSHLTEWSRVVECCYGQNVLQTKCETCGELNHIHEPCLGLTLAIKKGSDRWGNSIPNNIHSMLHEYMGKERIDGYVCDSPTCGGAHRVGNRVIKLSRMPPVLMFFLKRFDGVGVKIDATIQVQESIGMSEFSLMPSANILYRLVSIGCHTGSSPHGGHYFAVCRRGDKWFKIDDDDVSELSSFHDVSSRTYYMFVYERVV